MELDFFKDFEHIGSIKLGSELTSKIITLDSFQKIEILALKYPEEHEDAGNVMDAYSFTKERYNFAKEIGQLISDECTKIINDMKNKNVDKLTLPTNPQVLANLLLLVLNTETNFFTLG